MAARPVFARAAAMPAGGSVSRTVPVEEPIDLRRTVRVLRHGGGDPTTTTTADGAWWRAFVTPDGPATLRVVVSAGSARATGQAWGPGASWCLETLPGLLGDRDDRAGFVPGLPLIDRLHRTFAGWRLTYTGLVFETLVPVVIEQKVTGGEAFSSYRRLVRWFGEPAPGPGARLGLMLAPPPVVWRQIPVWDYHRAGLGPQRRDALVGAARVAPRLEEAGARGSAVLDDRLRALPGIGAWTSAEVRQRALADADAVSVGDAHIPHIVGHALTGARTDDAGMLRLLARWPGHRYRVTQLLAWAGIAAPRHGPRYRPIDHRGH